MARKRSYTRKQESKHPRNAIRILVEGSVTEKEYYQDLRCRLRLTDGIVGVESTIHSDPYGIVQDACRLKERDKRGTREGRAAISEWWVVVDVEDSHDPARSKNLSDAIQLAEANGIRMVLSAPSVEYWFLLHFAYTTRDFQHAAEAIEVLRCHLPSYDVGNKHPDCGMLWSRLGEALRNARKVRANHTLQGFDRPMTDCDILVGRIAKLAELSSIHDQDITTLVNEQLFVERAHRPPR